MADSEIEGYQGHGLTVFLISKPTGQLMTRLPSGDLFLTKVSCDDVQLLYHRMGFDYIGVIHGEFLVDNYDSLCKQLFEVRGPDSDPDDDGEISAGDASP